MKTFARYGFSLCSFCFLLACAPERVEQPPSLEQIQGEEEVQSAEEVQRAEQIRIAEQTLWCDKLAKRLKSVDAEFCRSLSFNAGSEHSYNGHPLFLFEQKPILTETLENKPGLRIFLIGGIHGDELTSISIVFRWMHWLFDAEASGHHWQIIPLANPDGLFVQPSVRTNGNGVDLNRNFPTPDWAENALIYWETRTGKDHRRYPGDAPMSESETRWMTEVIQAFQPDVILSVHAPYGVLDHDGPYLKPKRFGRLTLKELGVYPGSLGNFAGIHRNVPVVTIELAHASMMPPAAEQRQIWTDMLTWIAHNIEAKEE